jgi:hypothetical protein
MSKPPYERKAKALIVFGRNGRCIDRESAVSLQDVVASNGTPVPLFPNVLDNIEQVSANSTLLLHGLPPYKIIPPLGDSGEVVCRSTEVCIIRSLNLVSNQPQR